MFCIYCGLREGDRLSCCGERHFVSAKEFREYHGDWPEDAGDDEIEEVEADHE